MGVEKGSRRASLAISGPKTPSHWLKYCTSEAHQLTKTACRLRQTSRKLRLWRGGNSSAAVEVAVLPPSIVTTACYACGEVGHIAFIAQIALLFSSSLACIFWALYHGANCLSWSPSRLGKGWLQLPCRLQRSQPRPWICCARSSSIWNALHQQPHRL